MAVDWLEVVILFVAGTATGTINSVVGSGSLVTFPVLVALGYPPVLANVTNNIGILPGSISGAVAYRSELKGHFRAVLPLAAFSAVGGVCGALLLLVLPAAAFDTIVPILILLACVLVVAGPWLKRWAAARQAQVESLPVQRGESAPRRRVALWTSTGLTGVYGGYFGAAQGVILLAILPMLLSGGLQRANAYKNILAAVANGAAAVVFAFTVPIAWFAALVIAVGATLGGQIGGRLAQRLPPSVFRVIIVLIGVIAIVYFYVR
ncbi:MAG: sulfite exporter TauE/SafE family protein [Microbacteriaceae bacterium]